MITLRQAIPLVLSLALLSTSGCGLMVDGGYKLSSKKFSESVVESEPTSQQIQREEYEIVVQPNSSMRLACFTRTRRVERSWSVDKSFEYRGGYDKATYQGAGGLDGVVSAVIVGSMLGFCLPEDSDISCKNLLWAAPHAISMVYSFVRAATVKKPVLVDKSRSGDSMRFAATPLHSQETQCPIDSQLWIGSASGPSAVDDLNGRQQGKRLTLNQDSAYVAVNAEGVLVMSAEAASLWASHYFAKLWLTLSDGGLHPVVVDRCAVLRPHAASFANQDLQSFNRDCPLPTLPGQR